MKLNPAILSKCKILYKNDILDINSYDLRGSEVTLVECCKVQSYDNYTNGTCNINRIPYGFAPLQIKPIHLIALGGYDPDTPYLIEPEKDDTWVARDKTEPVGDLWAVEQLEYEKAFVEADETVEQTVPMGSNELPENDDELDEVYHNLRDIVECVKKKTDTASNCLTNVICSVRLVLPNVGTLEAPLAEFLVARDNGAKIEFAFVKESDK